MPQHPSSLFFLRIGRSLRVGFSPLFHFDPLWRTKSPLLQNFAFSSSGVQPGTLKKESVEDQKKESAENQKEESTENRKKSSWWKDSNPVIAAFGGSFFFILGLIGEAWIKELMGSPKKIKDTLENAFRVVTPHDIRKSVVDIQIPNFEEEYARRKGVEDVLHAYIDGELKRKYMVIYGAKGAGKSHAMLKTLSGKKGIAVVEINNYMDKTELSKLVAQKVMNTEQEVCTNVSQLYGTLAKAVIIDEKTNKRRYPTIVFELERGGTDPEIRLIQNVQSIAKKFSTAANVIIILSEVNGIMAFGADPSREKYMYVGDMTREEAKQLLAKLGKHLNDADLAFLYENVGGRPIQLGEFVRENVSVEEFVHMKLAEAHSELESFPKKYIQLLSLLKQQPDGVHITDYDIEDLRQFGKDMQNCNVVYYDIVQRMFRLQSQSHKVVLKDFPVKSNFLDRLKSYFY